MIPEEFEISIEIFTATLCQFHVRMNVIRAQNTLLRQERYSLLRGMRCRARWWRSSSPS